ncbi:hypothetical protein JOM56_011934 [Amanita muscaria]
MYQTTVEESSFHDLLGLALSRKPAGAGPRLAGTYQAVTQSSKGLRLRLVCMEAVGRGPGCGFSSSHPFIHDSDLSSLSDSDEDPIHLTDKVQMLLLRLSPLRTVEKELKQRLGAGTDEVRADVSFASAGAAGTAGFASRLRRPREFCVRKWNNVSDAASKFGRSDPSTFAGPGPGLTRPQSSRHDSNVVRLQLVDELTEVIASCRTDMMLLWTDPDVRNVLQKRN